MRREIIIILLLVLTCSFTSYASSTQRVAVLDFSGEGISAATLVALSDYFRTELIATGKYDVMDRNNLDAVLKEQAFQMSGACTDLGCMIQVGEILKVPRIMGGTIGKLGTKYLITVKVIDIESGRIDQSLTEKYLGALEDMDQPIASLASKIAGEKSTGISAKFYVTSDPSGAMVYLDDEFQGNSPITISVDEIREYIIKAELSGYNPWQQKTLVKPNEVIGIKALLAKYEGSAKDSPSYQSSNLKAYENEAKSA